MKTYPYLPELYLDPITKIVKAFYRPMIKVRISQNRGEISESFDALVDSGSDKNLFPIYFANKIRVSLEKNPKKIYGIGNSFIIAYTGRISLWKGVKKYETEADFTPEQRIPLLGRNGFFNLFKSIKFDENDKILYIDE